MALPSLGRRSNKVRDQRMRDLGRLETLADPRCCPAIGTCNLSWLTSAMTRALTSISQGQRNGHRTRSVHRILHGLRRPRAQDEPLLVTKAVPRETAALHEPIPMPSSEASRQGLAPRSREFPREKGPVKLTRQWKWTRGAIHDNLCEWLSPSKTLTDLHQTLHWFIHNTTESPTSQHR